MINRDGTELAFNSMLEMRKTIYEIIFKTKGSIGQKIIYSYAKIKATIKTSLIA